METFKPAVQSELLKFMKTPGKETLQDLLDRLNNEARAKVGSGRQSNLAHGLQVGSVVYIDSPPPPPQPGLSSHSNDAKNEALCKPSDWGSCGCTNCSNRKSVANLINEFEQQKTNLINELDALKSNCNLLMAQNSEVTMRIDELAEKVQVGGRALAELAVDDKKDEEVVQQDHTSGAGDSCCKVRLSQTFQNDLRTLQKYRNIFTKKLNNRPASNVNKSMELVENPTSQNNQKMVSAEEFDKVLKEKVRLEAELKDSHETNQYMVDKIQSLEKLITDLFKNERSLAKQAELNEKLELANSLQLEDPSVEMVQETILELGKIKEAFEKSQSVVLLQKEELRAQTLTISNMMKCTKELYDCIGNVLPKPEDAVINKASELPKMFDHLRNCVQQMLTDNGLLCKKLEMLQKVLKGANRENALLNEILASLNDDIEELSSENEKLMKMVKCTSKNCSKCTLASNSEMNKVESTNPEVEIKNMEDEEIKDVININDYINNSTVHQGYIADLQGMANFLTTIKKDLIQKPNRQLFP